MVATKTKPTVTKEVSEGMDTVVVEETNAAVKMEVKLVEPQQQKEETNDNYFKRLRSIDVGDFIEKKNGLSYLSWAYAVDLLYQYDPDANYEFLEPTVYNDGSMMVWCKLTAFGKVTTQYLPVMDFRNKAITNPNAMDINKAMQRCLAKAIATGTGLGLYIYRGEDIPVEETLPTEEKLKKENALITDFKVKLENTKTINELQIVWKDLTSSVSKTHPEFNALFNLKEELKTKFTTK